MGRDDGTYRGNRIFPIEGSFRSSRSRNVPSAEVALESFRMKQLLTSIFWQGSTFAGKQPKGLRKLILSNSPASLEPWDDAYMEYRKQLPQEMQDVMQKHEDAGTTDSEEYQNIMQNEFFKKHMCSVTPWPEGFKRSFEWAEKDRTVDLTM